MSPQFLGVLDLREFSLLFSSLGPSLRRVEKEGRAPFFKSYEGSGIFIFFLKWRALSVRLPLLLEKVLACAFFFLKGGLLTQGFPLFCGYENNSEKIV